MAHPMRSRRRVRFILAAGAIAAIGIGVTAAGHENPSPEMLSAAGMPADSTGVFLVEYSDGARSQSDSEDRVAEAASQMETWRFLAERGEIIPRGPMIGTRRVSVSDVYSDAAIDPNQIQNVDKEGIAAGHRAVEEVTGVTLPAGGDLDVPIPYFTELADVCGAPSAVSIHARNANGETASVLDSRANLRDVGERQVPESIERAWTFENESALGYIWEPAERPEVVVVVAVAKDLKGENVCTIQDVLEQVTIVVAGEK